MKSGSESPKEAALPRKAREATHHMEKVNGGRGSEQRLYIIPGDAWKPPPETEGSGEIWLATYAPSGVKGVTTTTTIYIYISLSRQGGDIRNLHFLKGWLFCVALVFLFLFERLF